MIRKPAPKQTGCLGRPWVCTETRRRRSHVVPGEEHPEERTPEERTARPKGADELRERAGGRGEGWGAAGQPRRPVWLLKGAG